MGIQPNMKNGNIINRISWEIFEQQYDMSHEFVQKSGCDYPQISAAQKSTWRMASWDVYPLKNGWLF